MLWSEQHPLGRRPYTYASSDRRDEDGVIGVVEGDRHDLELQLQGRDVAQRKADRKYEIEEVEQNAKRLFLSNRFLSYVEDADLRISF